MKTDKINSIVFFLFLDCVRLLGIATPAFAQDPIRVESKEVLVPVAVIDWERVKNFHDNGCGFNGSMQHPPIG